MRISRLAGRKTIRKHYYLLKKYTTQTIADATGAVLNTTDGGSSAKRTYAISPDYCAPAGDGERRTEKSLSNPDVFRCRQKLREEHGNGVVTTYTYELQTQRLDCCQNRTSGTEKYFRICVMEYDPVGNVL